VIASPPCLAARATSLARSGGHTEVSSCDWLRRGGHIGRRIERPAEAGDTPRQECSIRMTRVAPSRRHRSGAHNARRSRLVRAPGEEPIVSARAGQGFRPPRATAPPPSPTEAGTAAPGTRAGLSAGTMAGPGPC
jgi:hypothetical protein